jgi:hypothetical protein
MGEVERLMKSEGLRQDVRQERGTIHLERSIHYKSDIVECCSYVVRSSGQRSA